jgi:hypothetical protein
MAHNPYENQYAVLEFDDGVLSKRTLYRASERRFLEKFANNSEFTTVYADRRHDSGLLSFTYPKDAVTADLNVFRRAKSDDEIVSIKKMAELLDVARNQSQSEETFRGAMDSMDYQHAMSETKGDQFTLQRYGIKDNMGRGIEVSKIIEPSDEWSARLGRIYKGCKAVVDQLSEGVSCHDLDATFRAHMNPHKDVLYGRIIHHSGYEPWEENIDLDVLKRYDVFTVCPTVGDHQGNWAPLMHSIHVINDDVKTVSNFRAGGSSYQGKDVAYDEFAQTLSDEIKEANVNYHTIVGKQTQALLNMLEEQIPERFSTGKSYEDVLKAIGTKNQEHTFVFPSDFSWMSTEDLINPELYATATHEHEVDIKFHDLIPLNVQNYHTEAPTKEIVIYCVSTILRFSASHFDQRENPYDTEFSSMLATMILFVAHYPDNDGLSELMQTLLCKHAEENVAAKIKASTHEEVTYLPIVSRTPTATPTANPVTTPPVTTTTATTTPACPPCNPSRDEVEMLYRINNNGGYYPS